MTLPDKKAATILGLISFFEFVLNKLPHASQSLSQMEQMIGAKKWEDLSVTFYEKVAKDYFLAAWEVLDDALIALSNLGRLQPTLDLSGRFL